MSLQKIQGSFIMQNVHAALSHMLLLESADFEH